MPAQVEEVVVDADPVDVQDRSPDTRDPRLGRPFERRDRRDGERVSKAPSQASNPGKALARGRQPVSRA